MLNMRGEIVGIVTFLIRETEGINFAVSSQTAEPAANVLKTQAPTVSATATPQPSVGEVYPEVIEVEHHDTGAYWFFYGEYVNNTQSNLSGARPHIRFFDANEQPITDWLLNEGAGVSGILQPGERGYVLVYLNRADVPQNSGSYRLRVLGYTTTEAPYRDLRITNNRAYSGTDGWQHIAGTVTNDGQRTTLSGLAVAVIRRSDGALHEVQYDLLNSESSLGHELAPGESYDFDITLWRGFPPGGSYVVSGVSW